MSVDVSSFEGDRIPEEYRDHFETLVTALGQFSETSTPEDFFRDLMQEADTFLSILSDERGQLPEPVQKLDDLLWEWFNDPPSKDDFESEFGSLLGEIQSSLTESQSDGQEKEITNNTDSATNNVSNGENGSQTKTKPVNSDRVDEPVAESKSQGSLKNIDDRTDTEESFELEIDIDFDMLEDFLNEAEDQLTVLENLMVEVEESPDSQQLNELYRAMHTLKGGFGLCDLSRCSDLTHAAEDLMDVLREDPPNRVNENWMDLLLSTVDVIREILGALRQAIADQNDTPEVQLSPQLFPMLESDLKQAVEGVIDRDEFKSLDSDMNEDIGGSDFEQSVVKVDLDNITEVVDLVGELVISQSEVRDKINGQMNRELKRSLSEQEKIMNQLQERSMEMRMLPLQKEFKKLPRVVRDVSSETDKEVDLSVSGEQTELDQSVLDNLEAPLMHLVRNAIDHGIELPEHRREMGKPEAGQLEVRAYHESGHVYVEIEDDGAGLPVDDVEKKAIEKGFIDEDHDLDEDEICRQILKPGFSTSEDVTEVSGRGVGMDVVATQIDELGGNVLLDTEEGEGTTVTLELPLTVAIVDGLLTRIGEETFIFPVNQVEESINPDPGDVRTMQGEGRVVEFRDNVVPVIDPGVVLDDANPDRTIRDRTIMVIVTYQKEKFAVRVDELKAHEQIVIKQIESAEIDRAELTSGGAILGDGAVGLIMDVAGLVREFQSDSV